MPFQLNTWKQKIIGFAGALGAPGLFLISFLDSSVLTFPVINDLLLIELSIEHPARMPLYALMAATGSVLGCVLLYFIARKGGEAFFHRKAGERGAAIRHWVEENGFVGMLIAALLPPPTPFKFFVFAAGVFEVPLWSFASAISLARVIRYFGFGYLAVRYADLARRIAEKPWPYIQAYWWQILLAGFAFIATSYVLSRVLLRHKPQPTV